jgi:hypothetical protein
MSWLASIKSCWKMHAASSDVQNSKILELSGVQSKAMSLFVRIDTARAHLGPILALESFGLELGSLQKELLATCFRHFR